MAKRCKVIEQQAATFKQEMRDLFRKLMIKIPTSIKNMPMDDMAEELCLRKGGKAGVGDENDASVMEPPATVLKGGRTRGRGKQMKTTAAAPAPAPEATPRRSTRRSQRFGAPEPETPMDFDPRLPETPAVGRARRGQTIIGCRPEEGVAVQLDDGTVYDGHAGSAANMDANKKEQAKRALEATQAEVMRMLAELDS